MGIGTSIVMIAVGAVLKFAVTASVSGIQVATVGTILIVVGIVGLLVSLALVSGWGDRRGDRVVERDVVRDPDVVHDRRV